MIHRLLVANRGEIARRVFASCRGLGIETVAVFSDADADTPFAREADIGYALGGAAPADSYLRGDAIIEAARHTGADAIHPGYGFLAESAGFAQAVLDAGLIWVGPPPAAIEAMGSKIAARELMEEAGVPVLPGARVDGDGEIAAAAEQIGYPLLVKASAGGGGKGMRLVSEPAALAGAVAAARSEAGKAFGDETVFLERFSTGARHVEIQILGDQHGAVVALGERDCSVQRRHQKLIEESPSPAVDANVRTAMSDAAVAAGRRLGYVGAGTVEFLLTAEREFFFLEVNTRLQVEHPVTELVTGLDLVALQLAVAEGAPLPASTHEVTSSGHAIEARLCAEDPGRDFLPVTGTLTRFELPDGVRVDTGVESGSEISPHYDSMIAKVIAHGDTREAAIRKLADALARAELHGLRTNRDFLVRVLRDPEFVAGEADTGFLGRHDPAALARPLIEGTDSRAAVAAAALALQAGRRSAARVLGSLPSGWRNVPSALQEISCEREDSGATVVAGYRFDRRGGLSTLEVDGKRLGAVKLYACDAEHVDLELDGRREHYRIARHGELVHVNAPRAQLTLRVLPRHPDPEQSAEAGSLTAPMPGAVLRVLAEVGDRVTAGQGLLVIEAMKMEHEIVAPGDGVVTDLRVGAGDQVQAGAVLAVIDNEEDA